MQPIVHLLVPLGILLFLKVEPRKALLLSPLALLPDLDVFFSLHRALFHNLLFVAVIPIAVFFLSGKSRSASLIVAFVLASHLVLDFGYYGSAYLYPFDRTVYGFDFSTLSWITHSISETQVPYIFLKVPPYLFFGTALLGAAMFLKALHGYGLLPFAAVPPEKAQARKSSDRKLF